MTVFARIAAVAALLLAAACSGGPEVLEPDPTSTSSNSPRNGAVLPKKPALADEDSDSGAATFALYWVRMAHYASLTGDVEELKRVSTSDCVSCSKLIETFETTYARGGSYKGGERSFSDVSVETSPTTSDLLVRTTSEIAESTFTRDSESEPEKVAAESVPVSYRVSRIDGTWKMKEFAVDE